MIWESETDYCQEPIFDYVLNFYFQSNSPTFLHSSFISHDHLSLKQDKNIHSDKNWYIVWYYCASTIIRNRTLLVHNVAEVF